MHPPYWNQPPLLPDSIHIIQSDLVVTANQPTHWLSEAELLRLNNLQNKKTAQQYLASRNFIRQVLSSYLQIQPADLQFTTQPGGKPYLSHPANNLEFNLSHSNNKLLLGVSRSIPLGVDIEQIKNQKRHIAIAKRVFSTTDYARLITADSTKQNALFYDLWTQMEAKQKAFGEGVFATKIAPEKVTCQSLSHIENFSAAIAWKQSFPVPHVSCFIIAKKASGTNDTTSLHYQ